MPKGKIIALLLTLTQSAHADVYLYTSRVFNLVTGSAALVPNIKIEGDAAGFIVQDTNTSWTGKGIDGINYRISTLKYSYQGTITLTIDSSFYDAVGENCSFIPNNSGNKQLYIGWTVMQPGVTGTVLNSAGALYAAAFKAGVGVQSNWRGIDAGKPILSAHFNNSAISAYIYVTDGPAGMYTMPGGTKKVYVHTAGQVPNAVPYADIYGLSCAGNSKNVLGVGYTIPTDPIEPPTPDVVCDFSIIDTINLGSLDVTTALGKKASTVLSSQCTTDASVTAIIRTVEGQDNIIELGGLIIPVTFSNGTNALTYNANTGVVTQNIYAEVTGASSLIPGNYSQSMIVYLNYN